MMGSPSVINEAQLDQDLDLIGDLCDDDLDGDLVENGVDNCPAVSNELHKTLIETVREISVTLISTATGSLSLRLRATR